MVFFKYVGLMFHLSAISILGMGMPDGYSDTPIFVPIIVYALLFLNTFFIEIIERKYGNFWRCLYTFLSPVVIFGGDIVCFRLYPHLLQNLGACGSEYIFAIMACGGWLAGGWFSEII